MMPVFKILAMMSSTRITSKYNMRYIIVNLIEHIKLQFLVPYNIYLANKFKTRKFDFSQKSQKTSKI